MPITRVSSAIARQAGKFWNTIRTRGAVDLDQVKSAVNHRESTGMTIRMPSSMELLQLPPGR